MKKFLYIITFIAFTYSANAQRQLGKLQQYFLTQEEYNAFVPPAGDNTEYMVRLKIQQGATKYFQEVNPLNYPSETYFAFFDNVLYKVYRDAGGNYTYNKTELQKLYDDIYVVKNKKLKENISFYDVDIVIFNNYSILFATIDKDYNDKPKLKSNTLNIFMAGTKQPYSKKMQREWENNDWGEDWTKIYVPAREKSSYVDISPFQEKCWKETMELQQKNINDFVKNYSAKINDDLAAKNAERKKQIDAEIAANKDAEAKRISERDIKIKAFLQKYPEATLTMSENFAKWSAKGKPRLTHFIGLATFIPNRNLNAGLMDKMYNTPGFNVVGSKKINDGYKSIFKFDGEGPEVVIKLLKSPKTGRNFITFETDIYDYYQDHFGYSKSYYYSTCAGTDCEKKAKPVNGMEDGMFWYKGNLIVYYDVSNSQDAILVYSYPGAEPIPANMLQYNNESVFWNTYITQGLRHLQDAALIKK
jgi:hypothetical protein